MLLCEPTLFAQLHGVGFVPWGARLVLGDLFELGTIPIRHRETEEKASCLCATVHRFLAGAGEAYG